MALFLFSHRIEQMSIWPKKTRRLAKLTMQNVVIHTKGIDDCHIMKTSILYLLIKACDITGDILE